MSNKDLQPHPSLPARPPPSSYSAPPVRNNAGGRGGFGGNAAAFGGFAPRSVVAQAPAQVSTAPTMYSQPTVSAPYQPTAYPSSDAYYNAYQAYGTSTPAAAFAAPTPVSRGFGTYDPEEEARIAEWNSAYTREDASGKKGGNANTTTRAEVNATPDAAAGSPGTTKQKTVVREGGGKAWEDPSLLEWDPLHPRLFIGNLAGEVTDDSLLKAFSKYPSVSKARVVRDKRTTKSKSYGFVSFANTDDYFRAAKEMQGKYIGSHPVLIKRATSEVKATTKRDDKHGKHGRHNNNKKPGGGNNAAGAGAVPFMSSGVQKKGKSGGPRVLG
ncbi:RNA-binding domain-containing protein [Trematosphaeria pertusa]|uniref:RNA-binding domain-containing protein n=1 Tax=Trematosphaeria pertusa TaxID=390896 RepID=A0A6A6I5A1_9PLEO|nr:RNA-binding domain-containing protein [Trematosphaeria pertusa]KAF2244760.1 RNA-binding domain-containing protein [Trematosphaeria pertusa]